jgi:hypothetical protein
MKKFDKNIDWKIGSLVMALDDEIAEPILL